VETAAAAVRGRIREYLHKPVAIAELRRAVRAAADDARMARLRSKLLAARFGNEELLRDLPRTERQFSAALASLEMVYQPIVRARAGAIFAYEALMRTAEPTLAEPARLLSAAEALGRVEDLGRAVRAAVAASLAQHPERGEPIFVNVHPTELRSELFGDPRDPLLRFAHRVVFEVTEDGTCETGPRLEATLTHLRTLGYRLAIDDLGHGYGGLARLVDLRPEFAKIDMALVRNVHLDPFKRDIISSVVDLARRSRISIIAAGVEMAEERDVLVELGCDLLQGFWFARPAPPFARLPTTSPSLRAVG
jgi:EAL domain-containing protein (putative c-di-GMP-specific phosphodiesterase class I)